MKTVLIIDDYDQSIELFKDWLSADDEKFDVIGVENVAEGIERCHSFVAIDIIILDLNLDESQGIDTFRQLYEKVRTIPIIAVSGYYKNDDDAVLMLEEGAHNYISKNKITAKVLSREIKFAIARYRRARFNRIDIINEHISNIEKIAAG